MEKTISREEFNKIKVGDKVRIISEKPKSDWSVRLGWISEMDDMLGKVLEVETVNKAFTNITLKGYPYWKISEDMITEVYPSSILSYDEDLNTLFIKIFNDLEKTKKEEINIMKEINKVIYNEPATIVIWKDGTKTTCKCDKEDKYDREKGLALCVLKKILGGDQVANMLTLFEAATDHEQITWQQAKKKLRKNK